MARLFFPGQRLVALALLCFPIALSASPAKLETVSLYGNRYVSLRDWARVKGFSFQWDKPNKTVLLTNRWAKLTFLANSKRTTLNGLSFWISSPITVSGASVFIAERDLDKTIHPILYPEKLSPGKRVRTILIAAGHGGKDPGYEINKEQEKKYTLLMAKALKEALVAAGFRVMLSRETDVFIDLPAQAAQANRVKADLFITIHYNAAVDREPNGVETYCLTPAGATSTNGGSPTPKSPGHRQDGFNPLLAYQIHKSLTSNCAFQDRGIRRAGFQVLREITMPGVLIEGGFLSNPVDAKKITSAAHRSTAARAIVDGILSYKRLVERK
ncbi:MAG TPA: N-acetylmuramoyl-L-alanine amidase [Verrucomicrobiae bacterium]|nr:N-acetylmuramoyl-L-alanine amidase [Verrucomicrobiae bacterium]